MIGPKFGRSGNSRSNAGETATGLFALARLSAILVVAAVAIPCLAQNPNPPQPQPGLPPGVGDQVQAPSPMMRPWQLRMRQLQEERQAEGVQSQVPPDSPKPLPKPIVVQTPPPNQPLLQPSLKVDFVGGKLSVTADRMPLSQVLREVGRRTGLDVRGVQDASGVVSVKFSGETVAQGVQELLGGINYAVIGSLASTKDIREARVVVLSATSTDDLDVGGPLDAARKPAANPPGSAATTAARGTWRAELMSADPAAQDRGFAEINKLDPKEAFDALEDVVTNGDGVARLRALQFMDQDGSLDSNQVVGALRDALNDQDSTLRDYAIEALGRQSSPDALDSLRQLFESSDTATRLSILEAVSQRSDARSLIQQASNDPDQGVRTMANELLQSTGGQPQQPDVQPAGQIQLQSVPLDTSDPDGNPPPQSGEDDPPKR